MSTAVSVLHQMPTSLGVPLPRVSEDCLINLAHDLRQPLSAIESIAYYLELAVPPDQVQAHLYIARLQQLVVEAGTTLSTAVRDLSPSG
jgi:signal transduction histidine kinase